MPEKKKEKQKKRNKDEHSGLVSTDAGKFYVLLAFCLHTNRLLSGHFQGFGKTPSS